MYNFSRITFPDSWKNSCLYTVFAVDYFLVIVRLVCILNGTIVFQTSVKASGCDSRQMQDSIDTTIPEIEIEVTKVLLCLIIVKLHA